MNAAPLTAHHLPEAEGNRLLRRADWRFLLPDPAPGRAVCFAGGPLRDAVRASGACVVDGTSPGGPAHGECDLAVVADPDPATLRAAWGALRAGGTLYGEWRALPARTAAAVRQRLEAAGFESAACFAPRPDPAVSPAALWMPLDHTAALRHCLADGARARTGVRRVARAAQRAAWLASPHLRVASPVCAIATKPHPVPSDGGVSDAPRPTEGWLVRIAREHWRSIAPGPCPERLSAALLTRGARSINKVVALVFAGAERRPSLVLKAARVPESAAGLEREAAALRRLHERAGALPGVPQVLFSRRCAGTLVVGQTALPGVPLAALVTRRNARDLAGRATSWATRLARSTEVGGVGRRASQLIESVVADFERSFGGVADPKRLRMAAASVHALGDLPTIWEQRDFAPWNLLLDDRGELVVLDWESAEPHGLAALDLVYFLTNLGFFLDGAFQSGRFVESYRATLDPATPTGRLTAECLARYCQDVGISPALLHRARLFAWMLHSRSEYRELAADVGGPPSPEVLRRSRFFTLWDEEARRGP